MAPQARRALELLGSHDEPKELKISWEIARTIVDPRAEKPEPPRQITYQPEPAPDLTQEDWSLLNEVLSLIRRTIPTDDTTPPDKIFRIMREALLLHFVEAEQAS